MSPDEADLHAGRGRLPIVIETEPETPIERAQAGHSDENPPAND